ncbi:MAG TPA: hypothetical protein VJ925_11150 [Longimicrobiales bacterium]|nr:hypothetical protein [Longimicrobiales bacterium]
MARVSFSDQPDDARLWVFAARESLSADAVALLGASVDEFLDGWAAHGHPLRASRDIADDRFLFVAVDRASEPPSGCSIDAMVRHLKGLEGAVGTVLVAHGPVWFRDADGEIRCVTRPQFKQLAREGEVDLGTPVFDTTITELTALREGRFEVPARDAWHGAAFFG